MASARSSGAAADQLGSLYNLGAAGSLTDGQLLERFLTRDDPTAAEAAFAELVERHGTLVLSVCRRELGDPHDAHDAFQATFLVLVSKAAAVRHWDTVGGWLVGIARRVAARARVEGARRRRHLAQFGAERTFAEDRSADTMPSNVEPDYAALLAEVDRLPERFRAPVVLHYFEGLSTEATAQRLGCARGTVLSRLSRARDRLKHRLEQRGLAPAVLIPAGDALTRWMPTESVPAWLAQGTIRAAGSLGLAGAAIESVVPAAVAQLSRRVARTLVLGRVRVAAVLVVLAAAGVSIGLAATLSPPDEPKPGQAMERPQSAAGKPQPPRVDQQVKAEPLVLRGQVQGPDGKPFAGAELLLSVPQQGLGGEARHLGVAGADGRFEVSIPRNVLEPPAGRAQGPFLGTALAAVAPGLGPDWLRIDLGKADEPVNLKLRRDDVPIEGHVISLEGRPIPNLSVRVAAIAEFPPALMNKLRENAGNMNGGLWDEMRNVFVPGEKGAFRPVQIGADGRFRMAGIGRDRVAFLIVEGGSIEQSFAMVSTTGDRKFKPVPLPADGSGGLKIQAPRFELSVAPGLAFGGIVRDRDTGRPVAGANIITWSEGSKPLKTDSQGRFRLAGQPRGRPNFLTITVDDEPYIKVAKPLQQSERPSPAGLDITLKKGVWVEGKVTNRANGKPVKAVVTYYPFRDNPSVKDCPDASFLNNHLSDEAEFPTDAQGRFRAVALPGGGVLAVQASEPGYLTAKPLASKVAGNVLHAADFNVYMYPYHVVVPIDAPAGRTLVLPDITLAPGRTQHIKITGPDGRPVAGAGILCLQRGSVAFEPVVGSEWTFIHANPGKAESAIISHVDRALGATIDLKGDEPDPVQVVLQPCGTVTGRLVDEDGKPRPDVRLAVNQRFMSRGSSNGTERLEGMKTGPDGRFRITNLVPGLTYYVEAIRNNEMNYSLRAEGYLHKNRWTVKPGETLDWGDVQAKAYGP
jgi:RNA polymerase sigma factor (sigma-70 family)